MFHEDLEKTNEIIYGFYKFLNANYKSRYQTDDWRSAALAEASAEVATIAEKA